jgi:hypothetical protein
LQIIELSAETRQVHERMGIASLARLQELLGLSQADEEGLRRQDAIRSGAWRPQSKLGCA